MSPLPLLSDKLIEELNTAGPRYTSYPTVPEWSAQFREVEYTEVLKTTQKNREPIGVYVHIPFCERRCSFCGCNVVVTRSVEKADRYLDYINREMDLLLPHLGHDRKVQQLHWGGGTPTFLREHQLLRLYGIIISRLEITPNAEISLEVDPTVTTKGQIELLAHLGFNRISLGVQDFDSKVQRGIHRQQSFEDTKSVIEHARKQGFGGINLDLIYGLPHQTIESWSKTIDQVIDLEPDRLAIFSFAYLPNVRPNQKRLRMVNIPNGAEKYQLFRLAYNRLVEAGYEPIGMDHFARQSDELAIARRNRTLARNFQGYTAGAPPDSVGFGLTAISDVGGCYSQNAPQLKAYEEAIDSGHLPTNRGVVRSKEDEERARIIQSLMCNAWASLGTDGDRAYKKELKSLSAFAERGLLKLKDEEIELTPLGMFFVRNIAMVFDTYLHNEKHEFSRAI